MCFGKVSETFYRIGWKANKQAASLKGKKKFQHSKSNFETGKQSCMSEVKNTISDWHEWNNPGNTINKNKNQKNSLG